MLHKETLLALTINLVCTHKIPCYTHKEILIFSSVKMLLLLKKSPKFIVIVVVYLLHTFNTHFDFFLKFKPAG
jgi:hypothetical protein